MCMSEHTYTTAMLEGIHFKYMTEYHYVTKECVCNQGLLYQK